MKTLLISSGGYHSSRSSKISFSTDSKAHLTIHRGTMYFPLILDVGESLESPSKCMFYKIALIMTLTQVSPSVKVITVYLPYIALLLRHPLCNNYDPNSSLTICQSHHCLPYIALLLRHPLCGNYDAKSSLTICQSHHCLPYIALLLRHPLCGNYDPNSSLTICQSYHCLPCIALLLRHPLCGNEEPIMVGLMYNLSLH